MREVFTRSCWALGFVLLVLIPMTAAWRSFKVILTDVDFEVNDKILNLTVDLQNEGSDYTLSLDFTTYQDLDDVQLAVDVGLETDKGNFSVLINRTLNFCKLMKQRNSDPLVRGIYDDLLKHGNLFKDCPIRSGSFRLTNYKVDEELLPSFLPETKFRFGILITRPKNERIVRAAIYGRIDKSKGFDNLKRFSMG